MPVEKLTQEMVDELTFDPCGKQTQYLWDTVVTGLGVRLVRSGKHSYYLRYTMRPCTKSRFFRIGGTRQLRLTKARELARYRWGQVFSGSDPQLELRREAAKAKSSPTLRDLRRRSAEEIEVSNSEKIRREKESMWKRIFMFFGPETPVEEITRDGVVRLFHELSAAPSQANAIVHKVLMQALRRAANSWVRSDGTPWYPHRLPQDLPKNPTRMRQRSYSGRELLRLLSATRELEHDNPTMSATVRLLLYTGARVGEFTGKPTSARWDDYQRDHRKVSLAHGKADVHDIRGRHVFVPELALDNVEQLRELRTSDWMVPGRSAEASLSYGSLRRYWVDLCRVASLTKRGGEPATLHTLRHTFVTVSTEAGLPFQMVARLVGHRVGSSMTDRYSHPSDRKLAEYANQAGAAMAEYIGL